MRFPFTRMQSIGRKERIARSALLVSAAIVTAMVLGIGYQQQNMRSSLSASAALPFEEELFQVEPPADEPLVWCRQSDSGLCFEQPALQGCPDNSQEYFDVDSCTSASE